MQLRNKSISYRRLHIKLKHSEMLLNVVQGGPVKKTTLYMRFKIQIYAKPSQADKPQFFPNHHRLEKNIKLHM